MLCTENRTAVAVSPWPHSAALESRARANSPYTQVLRTQLTFTLESQCSPVQTPSKLKALKALTEHGQHRARRVVGAEGGRERLTSDSLVHIVSCQPSSGGDSGRNTQSAPQAKALTRARYLRGNSKDQVRLPLGTQSSGTDLGRQNAQPAWELLAPMNPSQSICTGVQGSPGGWESILPTQIMSAHTYPQCLPITSRTKVLWWLEKRKGKRPLSTAGKSKDTESSAVTAMSGSKAAPELRQAPGFRKRSPLPRSKRYCKSISNFCE